MSEKEIEVTKEQQLISETEEERNKRAKSCLEEVTKVLEKHQCRINIQSTIVFTPLQIPNDEQKTA